MTTEYKVFYIIEMKIYFSDKIGPSNFLITEQTLLRSSFNVYVSFVLNLFSKQDFVNNIVII